MKLKKILAVFLLSMAVLTWLSRILDSITVTKVGIGYAKEGTVSYEIVGEGTFTAAGYTYVNLPEGMPVAEILKKPGQKVTAGEAVLALQMEPLKEEREKLDISRQKTEILLKQERLSARKAKRVTEETLELQRLEALQKELGIRRGDQEDALADYSSNIESLRQEYNRKSDRSEDEIREELKRELKSAERAYDAAMAAKRTAVNKAERIVNTSQEKLDRLILEGGKPEEIEAAEEALDQAIEDLEYTEEEQEAAVDEAEAKRDDADVDYEDREYNSQDTKEELKKNYETAVKAEEETLKAADRKVSELEESIYQSNQRLENARVSDADILAAEEASLEISRLREQSLALDLSEAEKRIEKIDNLIEEKGQITAPVDGIVTEMDIKEGDTIAAGDQLRLAGDDLKLTALVDKEEAEQLKPGSAMMVKKPGEQKYMEAVVEHMSYLPEEKKAEITAKVPDDAGILGAGTTFTVKFQSGMYRTVIPIEAVRQDNKGYFCLVTEPKKTILGEELAAVRVHLEVLEKSTVSCAVSGALSTDMQVILSSNKEVREGDRIRVAE